MRAVNRLASLLLALAMLAVGLFVIVQTVMYLAGRPPWLVPLESWRDTLATTELADRWILVAGIAAVVVGAGILLLQLRPVTPTRLRTQDRADDGGFRYGAAGSGDSGRWWLERRSVERRAAAAAQSAWGIHDVRTRARGRPGKWALSVSADAGRGGQTTGDAVQAQVRRELDRLDAPADVPVSVSLRRDRRVA